MKFKIEKKSIYSLDKCYSIAPLLYQNKQHFLVAAEKVNECVLFDMEGNVADVIWKDPGGTMSMIQVPDRDGQFLATQKFYSPNDSKEARIVIVTAKENGKWGIETLVELPHVHRFDILERNGVHYLVACTLKSGHDYKDDWSKPGKVYVAELPKDLSGFSIDNQLKLTVLKENMIKNHGYYRVVDEGIETSIISAESGVYQFVPPSKKEEEWEIKKLLDTPASDAVLVDLDEDGEKELVVLSPFHGDQIRIYRKQEGTYNQVYEYEKRAEFLHAIGIGVIAQKPVLILGHRNGEQNLMLFTFDQEKKDYQMQLMDSNCGSANVSIFYRGTNMVLISANRETNEVALYQIEADS